MARRVGGVSSRLAFGASARALNTPAAPLTADFCYDRYMALTKKKEEAEERELNTFEMKQKVFIDKNIEEKKRLAAGGAATKSSSRLAGGVEVVRTISKRARSLEKKERRNNNVGQLASGAASDSRDSLPVDAEGWLRKAASLGHVMSNVVLGNMMLGLSNSSLDKSVEERKKFLQQALDCWEAAGTKEALFNSGHVHFSGHKALGFPSDVDKAMECFKLAVEVSVVVSGEGRRDRYCTFTVRRFSQVRPPNAWAPTLTNNDLFRVLPDQPDLMINNK